MVPAMEPPATEAVDGPDRPRLVLFRWLRPGLPPFISQHLDEHVRCLRHHFDVVVIGEDCDYGEVCERHRPDLAVFESGVYAGPRRITGTSSCPDVPKIGFCNADAYCATRSVFLSDMERWGVETFFTLAVAMPEYTPEIADRLFLWPNFVDPGVYRDYGQAKNIPILFTGSQAPHYPWRSRIHGIVAPRFPCLTTPHAGWFDDSAAGNMIQGSGYARLLNAAMIAPTCGTIARDLIRKHFEIPASRTCLVTERTASVEAAGFVDMENAVFADQGDVVDKLQFLFSHPDELRRITDAGFKLAHSRHTMAQRDQMLQWLRLHRAARPGQRIVQTGPFEPLRLIDAAGGRGNTPPLSGGLDRALLREGERLLDRGRLQDAETMFLRCLNYHFMPEPVLGLTRRHLHGGDPREAIRWVTRSIERGLVHHQAQDPDPVEWAYFVRALICAGRLDAAAERAQQFPRLRHLELERIRWALSVLRGDAGRAPAPPEQSAGRPSVHALPRLDARRWLADLDSMLRACGRAELADSLAAGVPARRPASGADALADAVTALANRRRGLDAVPLVPDLPHVRLRRRLGRSRRARRDRADAGSPRGAIRQLAQREDLHSALLLRASASSWSTRALLDGLSSNPNSPEIVWVDEATPILRAGRSRHPGRRVPWRGMFAEDDPGCAVRFDLVAVGAGGGSPRVEERGALQAARFLVLTGINSAPMHLVHASLIEDEGYALVTHHPSRDNGCSVFRRLLG